MNGASEVYKIRHRVHTEVARLHWEGRLKKDVKRLPDKLVASHEQRYRCCEYKEKAIYQERIKLAMGLSLTKEDRNTSLRHMAEQALDFPQGMENQIEVIDIACDNCPINRYFITNACRNCLVHSCQQACPKGAITVVQGQAYIDQDKCVECGLCIKSCRFGAILEIKRPCEQACGVKAIKSGENRKAVIDYEKCVDCGACVLSCPFGAISDRSQLLKVIDLLKGSHSVAALIAPSIRGQFGQKEDMEPIIEALRKLGFDSVLEVASGADMVAAAEGGEVLRRVPREIPFMTSSCCPSFVKLIKKHQPSLEGNISGYVSPMVVTAGVAKKNDPEMKTVFIGPCFAKKAEAREYKQLLDAVITFEELAALLEVAGMSVSQAEEAAEERGQASALGNLFAVSGGVTDALKSTLPVDRQNEMNFNAVQGLADCQKLLAEAAEGKVEGYIEGMACSGGCAGGPGTLVNSRLTKKYLQGRGKKLNFSEPMDNPQVKEVLGSNHEFLHRKVSSHKGGDNK